MRAALLGLLRQSQNASRIPCKIADRGIELREGYFHAGTLEYGCTHQIANVRRENCARCVDLFIERFLEGRADPVKACESVKGRISLLNFRTAILAFSSERSSWQFPFQRAVPDKTRAAAREIPPATRQGPAGILDFSARRGILAAPACAFQTAASRRVQGPAESGKTENAANS